jgi:CobQ-like glutamine amidotransferase family enzyme
VLPKNPWLADLLLALALEHSVGAPVNLDPLDDAIEQRNRSVALQKAMRNRGQRTAIEPARLGRSVS